MGRPLEKSDCDELAYFVHRQNAICSHNLLEALKANHGDLPCAVEATAVESLPVRELPPIPNIVIAEAADIAFPIWVNAIKRIQHAVCVEYNISHCELVSQRRHKNIVRPRQVAMYLCKNLTDRSFPEIGRKFGGRDHSTAISAVRRVELLRASDETFRVRVDALAEAIGGTL